MQYIWQHYVDVFPHIFGEFMSKQKKQTNCTSYVYVLIEVTQYILRLDNCTCL
jgi:predicted nucleic acid-binding Zn finger protein